MGLSPETPPCVLAVKAVAKGIASVIRHLLRLFLALFPVVIGQFVTRLHQVIQTVQKRFPGVIIQQERIWVNRTQDLDPGLEALYTAYLDDDLSYGATSEAYALGLLTFLALVPGLEHAPAMLKGQVTGPISWGLTVVDQDRRPVLYDEILADAAAKHLRLKATWMEKELAKKSPQTIIFVDEPYMSSYGSAFVSLHRDQVISLMEEVFSGIEGLKGVHCCGNTDWSLLMSTTVDILHLDAYGYVESLALYPEQVAAFRGRGGIIAWGIVPASDQALDETVDSLLDRFDAALNLLTAKGLHKDDLLASALIMPSCGCGSLAVKTAERVIDLTGQVAKTLQERYGP